MARVMGRMRRRRSALRCSGDIARNAANFGPIDFGSGFALGLGLAKGFGLNLIASGLMIAGK
jgi:hypothetical protein